MKKNTFSQLTLGILIAAGGVLAVVYYVPDIMQLLLFYSVGIFSLLFIKLLGFYAYWYLILAGFVLLVLLKLKLILSERIDIVDNTASFTKTTK